MNIVVTGKHVEVTDALRTYVREKVGKLTRFFDHFQEADVVLRVERHRRDGNVQIVEVTMWGDGIVLRGEEGSPDMYASIDVVSEKLEKQIEKYRSRLIEKRRIDEARRKQAAANRAIRERAAAEEASTEGGIVRRKRFAMKPMTADEAALQMDLVGHSFFVFRDADTERIHVLYRRRDGDFGLIETE
jgi:putative sigma-54 modulation protein